MMNLWLLSIINIVIAVNHVHAAKLSFKPSSSNVTDEYCTYKLDNVPVSSYCDDIDNILLHMCGNTTFLEMLHPSYNAKHDTINDECIFSLLSEQMMHKTYSISDQVPIDKITFSSNSPSTISVSQSFVSIISYSGSININNIHFISNGDIFSFMDVKSSKNELRININSCKLSNFNTINGAIINIPNNGMNTDDTAAISIVFEDCVIDNNVADYGGILFIERNNVYVTLSNVDIHDIVVDKGAVVQWLCQQHNNIDLCGDLYISNTIVNDTDANIFTIDLSSDPSRIQFILEVDDSIFSNINGIIFNFNRNDDELAPSDVRIQEQNTFINITNSRFEDNGHKQGIIEQWLFWWDEYIDWYSYPQNGTIFKINSFTLPNITVQNSVFKNNGGLFGTIFHWYCSRRISWIKDSYCGSIVLQNNIFDSNLIPDDWFERFGSVLYAQIHQNMEFNLMIQNCKFIEQIGNAIYFETATESTPYIVGNHSLSNVSVHLNTSMDYIVPISIIYIDNSQFIKCGDDQDPWLDAEPVIIGAILTIKGLDKVYTLITDSTFDGNQCRYGSAVFSADYALINITNTKFTGNAAAHYGIFHIQQERNGLMEIYDSIFSDNGYYKGGYYGAVSIISTEDDVDISLNIMRSSFIKNGHEKYGCFSLYSANINITDSTFDSNKAHLYSVIVLYLRDEGNLNIVNSIFRYNAEVSFAFGASSSIPQGMFHVKEANIVADDVEFRSNTVLNNGIFVTKKSIVLIDNKYIENSIPRIVDARESVGNVKIEDSAFEKNEVTVVMIDAKDVSVDYSKFLKNSMSSLFGSYDEEFSLTLSESEFRRNRDAENGGIIFASNSNVQIDINGCRFQKNSVSGNGGVIYIEGSGLITIKDSQINQNKAEMGEFIFAKGSNTLTINIMDTKFDKNFANGDFGSFLHAEDVTVNIGGDADDAAMFIEKIDNVEENIERMSDASPLWFFVVTMVVCGVNVLVCLWFKRICREKRIHKAEQYDYIPNKALTIDVEEDECDLEYEDK